MSENLRTNGSDAGTVADNLDRGLSLIRTADADRPVLAGIAMSNTAPDCDGGTALARQSRDSFCTLLRRRTGLRRNRARWNEVRKRYRQIDRVNVSDLASGLSCSPVRTTLAALAVQIRQIGIASGMRGPRWVIRWVAWSPRMATVWMPT